MIRPMGERWSRAAQELWDRLRGELDLPEQIRVEDTLQAIREALDHVHDRLDRAEMRGDELYALCPFHNDKHVGSFSVNRHTGRYFCFACGARGGVHQLFRKLGIDDLSIRVMLKDIDFEALTLFLERGKEHNSEEVQPLPEGVLSLFPYLPIRLLEKGHPERLLEQMQIGFDPHHFRITFPVRRSTGELVAIQSRAVREEDIRWKFYRKEFLNLLPRELVEAYSLEAYRPPRKTVFFNEHNVFSSLVEGRLHRPLVLTEGPGHCLRVLSSGFPCVGSFGTQLGSGQLPRLLYAFKQVRLAEGRVPEVIIATDGDEPGRRSAFQISMQLQGTVACRVADIPPGCDPEDLTTKELRSRLLAAPPFEELLHQPTWQGEMAREEFGAALARDEEQRERERRRQLWLKKQEQQEREQVSHKGDVYSYRAQQRAHRRGQSRSDEEEAVHAVGLGRWVADEGV